MSESSDPRTSPNVNLDFGAWILSGCWKLDLGCLISASLLRRLQGLVRCPQRLHSSRLKIFLEVGAQLDQFLRGCHWPELRAGNKHFKHLLEIILVVGAQ